MPFLSQVGVSGRCSAVSRAVGSELYDRDRLGGCCTAPAAFPGKDNLCSQPLSAIFATLLGAHLPLLESRVPHGALGAFSRQENWSRGLGMERQRGSGSASKCSSLCWLLFPTVGVGLTPGTIAFSQARCLRASPHRSGSCPSGMVHRGFGATCTTSSSCRGCVRAVIQPFWPMAIDLLHQQHVPGQHRGHPFSGPGCLLPEAPTCLPAPGAGPGQYASQLSLPLVIPPPLK